MGITRLAATSEYRGRVRQEHLDLFFTMWDRTGPDRGKPLNPDEEAAVKIINPMLRRVWGG